jgi:hypothetical protein
VHFEECIVDAFKRYHRNAFTHEQPADAHLRKVS